MGSLSLITVYEADEPTAAATVINPKQMSINLHIKVKSLPQRPPPRLIPKPLLTLMDRPMLACSASASTPTSIGHAFRVPPHPPLRGSEPGSFAEGTISERLPAILRSTAAGMSKLQQQAEVSGNAELAVQVRIWLVCRGQSAMRKCPKYMLI